MGRNERILNFIRKLHESDLGNIILINMSASIREGLVKPETCTQILADWEDIANHLAPDLAANCICDVRKMSGTRIIRENVIARGKGYFGGKVVSVRQLWHIKMNLTASSMFNLSKARAVPSTCEYRSTLANFSNKLDEKLGRKHAFAEVAVKLKKGKSITNPRNPRAIFWFADKEEVMPHLLNASQTGEFADKARNILGLNYAGVHTHGKSARLELCLVSLDREEAENRSDSGRPTFLEAEDYQWFKAIQIKKKRRKSEGETINLEQFLIDNDSVQVGGISERVCGPMPLDNSKELEMEIHSLGRPTHTIGVTEEKIKADYADWLIRKYRETYSVIGADVVSEVKELIGI